ncbi:MAG: ABC transporter permease [Polyangiales bacterium]
MILTQTFALAARALLRSKTRSFLTMLGVIIGVASVISMVAVGEGAKARVEGVFASMGSNLLIVLSGSTMSGGVAGGFGSMPTLTWEDLAAIQRDAPAVKAAAPQISARVTLRSDTSNWTSVVAGTTPAYFPIRAFSIERGVTFAESDVQSGAKIVVLGQTVADRLFGPGLDPIGRSIRIKGVPFTVIGLLVRKGQSPMGQDYDDVAVVPVTTFQAKIQGGLGKFIPGVLLISAITADDTKRAQLEMASILRDRHHLTATDEDDFNIRNLTELASAQEAGTRALTGLLAAIAVVSLIVGGIGIMNIMLVSVTERTREIGLRMAIGAKPAHVLLQFLTESITLSTIGGVIGIALGTGVARAVASKFGWAFVPRMDTIAIAFGFSVFVGAVFGLYPAAKAARFDPIEALRFE